jgi:hypothetical protein
MHRFRIVREGGKYFIEKLTNKRWVGFPVHKYEKFHSPEHARRWLVDNGNWAMVNERELIEEIEIDPTDFDGQNEPCLSVTRITNHGIDREELELGFHSCNQNG